MGNGCFRCLVTSSGADLGEFSTGSSMQAEPQEQICDQGGLVVPAARRELPVQVGLLTAGNDRPYALGLALALAAQSIFLELIGSDALDAPELHNSPFIRFLNFRGDQAEGARFGRKITRLLSYYGRLIKYAATARPKILHILWNNKFEFFDRVVLMLYYRLLGKRTVLTAHNVNAAKRDGKDSLLNRMSLEFQYRMCSHIFVHTEGMKHELVQDFKVRRDRVTVIPFGINNTIPTTEMTTLDAKGRLGLSGEEKTALFFGQIAPYKGLEYLVAAMAELVKRDRAPHLIIAGKVKRGYTSYWEQIRSQITPNAMSKHLIERIQFIPDDEVELYFKAADLVILPYAEIYQSGLPFLAYSFGVPIIATDVGALRDDVVEGETGYICKAKDPHDLASSIEFYFSSELYRQLEINRLKIQNFANEKHSWSKAAEITRGVYRNLIP
jgi:D-inositol-3-phosphate glycosyltransferase